MDRNFNYRENQSISNANYSSNNSIKTPYSRRQSNSQNPKNLNNQYSQNLNYKNQNYLNSQNTKNNIYNLPDTNRVFNPNLQEEPKYFKVKNIMSFRPNDNWNSMMSRTSNEESICGTNQRISKSKTYQSKIFPNENEKI